MKKTILFTILILFAGIGVIKAQSGSIDPTFSSGSGAGTLIQTTTVQADGKILIGGYFTNYGGNPINRIARVNSDGSFDGSFNPGTGANDVVNKIAVQSDGKILIAGSFSTVNGINRSRIARLNADGTLDGTFDPGTGASNNIFDMVLQQDGKILIVGAFSSYNAVGRNGIARLNTDGSLDGTFDPGAGSGINAISRIALQSDGKLVIGGGFITYNNIPRNYMARVNNDGSLDNTFNPGLGAFYPKEISIQTDGKILIGGGFNNYNGTPRNGIARINSDGTLDNSFDPGLGAESGDVESIVLLANGNLVIVGSFTSYNGTSRNYISGVLSTGQLDNDFVVGTGFDWVVSAIASYPNNKLVIVGNYNSYNGNSANQICRILLGEPVVYIPDVNFKAYLIGNSSINTNSDTEIQFSEAVAFTGIIDCSNSNVADLTGIEEFVNMTQLNCFLNQLTSIDISNNTALTHLQCGGNQLLNLDLSNNINLTDLRCSSNQLTSLDVSNNLLLQIINCNTNQLTSFDMSSNPAVTFLSISNNLLNELNLKNGNNNLITNPNFEAQGNQSLICIEVDDADYSNANWTNIDAQTSFDEDCSALSLSNNYFENTISIYPNPTKEILSVELKEATQLTVLNILGELVLTINLNAGNNTLDVTSYPSGVYFIRFTKENGSTTQTKFIKE